MDFLLDLRAVLAAEIFEFLEVFGSFWKFWS
jgi:hypothetical protein